MSPSRDQSPISVLAFATALFMLAAHVAGKATRDALFLSNFPIERLPNAMVAAGAISLVSAAGMARLLTRVGPGRLVPMAFAGSALLFVGEWLLLTTRPAAASVVVYLHYTALGAVLISSFWSVVNERFDPRSARSTIARIGGFAALGGVVGGLGAERISAVLGLPALLLMLAFLHAACALTVLAMTREPASRRATPEEDRAYAASGLRTLAGTPYLLQMAALVGVVAVLDAFVDYAFKAEASARFRDGASLIQFFALFYTVAGFLAFLVQVFLGERVLRNFGLGNAMAVMPAAVLLTGTLASFATRLWSVILVRGASFALANSFFRMGFEVLYTPLAAAEKRPTKAYVDVGAQRVGDMLGGTLILALLALVPGLPSSIVLAIAMLAAGAALLLIVRLNRGYVRQLAAKLRSGTLTLDSSDAIDVTTQRTLERSRVTLDRAELLARIEELGRAESATESPSAADATAGREEPAPTTAALEPFFEQVKALTTGGPEQVRSVLESAARDARLVPHVLPLLARFDVLPDVLGYLRRVAPRALGQLVDALADPERSVLVRRRIPQVLASQPGRRALEGLVLGLEDADFDVRLQCSRSLARLFANDRALRPGEAVVFAVVGRELGVDPRAWEHQGRRREEPIGDAVLLEGVAAGTISRSLEHVFTLLSLILDPQTMRSALLGLSSGDATLRGTALEYLEATLPEELSRSLFARLPGAPSQRGTRRGGQELAEELLRTSNRPRTGREDP